MKPHRGVLVLVLGIIGLVSCQLVGIFAWVLGNQDLREMDAGIMDPEGRQMTQIGKILGIISVAIIGLQFVLLFLWLVVVIGMSAAS